MAAYQAGRDSPAGLTGGGLACGGGLPPSCPWPPRPGWLAVASFRRPR